MPSHHHESSRRESRHGLTSRGDKESGKDYEEPISSQNLKSPVERWLRSLAEKRAPGMQYLSSRHSTAPSSRQDDRIEGTGGSQNDTQRTGTRQSSQRRGDTRSSAFRQQSTSRSVPQETILPTRSDDPRKYGFRYIKTWTERQSHTGQWREVIPDQRAVAGEREAHLYQKTSWFEDKTKGVPMQKNEKWTTYTYV